MANIGKIDKVHEEIMKMEERFTRLEREQQRHFEEHIEKAAASIISEIKKEIINLLKTTNKEKVKEEEEPLPIIIKPKISKGWYPENLKIEDTPFYK